MTWNLKFALIANTNAAGFLSVWNDQEHEDSNTALSCPLLHDLGRVLSYIGYIGMCRPKRYGFWAVLVRKRWWAPDRAKSLNAVSRDKKSAGVRWADVPTNFNPIWPRRKICISTTKKSASVRQPQETITAFIFFGMTTLDSNFFEYPPPPPPAKINPTSPFHLIQNERSLRNVDWMRYFVVNWRS